MNDTQDELLDSEYDGIQEYDNNLPTWWVVLFWGCIAFGIAYTIYFHVLGLGLFPREQLALEMEAYEARKQQIEQAQAEAAAKVDLVSLAGDQSVLEQGKAIYDAKCVACHGALAQGIVGPNLTDDYWIHGGTIKDIKHVIVNGVLDKGMLAWKDQLSSKDIDAVTAYVWSLHGTNPEGAKEPQGELVPRE